MCPTIGADADRQHLGKESNRLLVGRSEGQRRRVVARHTSTGEVVTLVAVPCRAGSLLHHAARAGAQALVLRSDSEATLVRAVERVCRGQRHMPMDADDRPREPARERLSPRELEVAALIASGRSTKEAARILGVTSKTGDTYRTRLMRKIGAHSVVDGVFFAIRHGLIDID